MLFIPCTIFQGLVPNIRQKQIVRSMSLLDFQSYLTYLISFLLDTCILNFNLSMFVFHLKTYYQQIITSNVSKTVSKVLESVYSKNLSNTKYMYIVLYTQGVLRINLFKQTNQKDTFIYIST